MFSDNLDFSSFAEAIVNFSFMPESMEPGEDFFLEVSTDGGSSYTIIQEWNSGVEFFNGIRQNPSVVITSDYLSTNTVIRFRCDASTNSDRILIDDVVLETCGSNLKIPQNVDGDVDGELSEFRDKLRFQDREKDIELSLYPNPARDFLYIELGGYANDKISKIEILTSIGAKLQIIENVDDYNCKLNLEAMTSGQAYLMILKTQSGEIVIEKFFKI